MLFLLAGKEGVKPTIPIPQRAHQYPITLIPSLWSLSPSTPVVNLNAAWQAHGRHCYCSGTLGFIRLPHLFLEYCAWRSVLYGSALTVPACLTCIMHLVTHGEIVLFHGLLRVCCSLDTGFLPSDSLCLFGGRFIRASHVPSRMCTT